MSKGPILQRLSEVRFSYNEIVFMFPPWEAIYRTDAERDQSFAESIQVYEKLRRWYEHWKYQPIDVPTAEIDARVDFIVQTVDLALTRARSGRPTA